MRSANFSRLLAYLSLLTLATSVVAKPLPKEVPYNPQYKTLTARQAANDCHPNIDNLPENCSNAAPGNGATDGLPSAPQLIAHPSGNAGASASGNSQSGANGSATGNAGTSTDANGSSSSTNPAAAGSPAGTSTGVNGSSSATNPVAGTINNNTGGSQSQVGVNAPTSGGPGVQVSPPTGAVAGTVNNANGGPQSQVGVNAPTSGGPAVQVSPPTGAQAGSGTVSNTPGGQGTVSSGDAIDSLAKVVGGVVGSLTGSQSPNGSPALSNIAVAVGSPNLPSVNAQPQAGTNAGSSAAIGFQPQQGGVVGSISGTGANPLNVNVPAASGTGSSASSGNVQSGANVGTGVTGGPINLSNLNLSTLNLSTLNLATLRSIVQAVLAAPGSSQSAGVTAFLANLRNALGLGQGSLSLQSLQTLLESPSLVNQGSLNAVTALATVMRTQPGANASAGNNINLSNLNLPALNLSTLNLSTLRSIVQAIIAAPGSSQSANVTAFLNLLSNALGLGQGGLSLQSLQTLLESPSLVNQGSLNAVTALGTVLGTQSGANASAGNNINLSNLNLSTLNLSTLNLANLRSIVQAILAAPGTSQSANVPVFLNLLNNALGLGQGGLSLQSLQSLLGNASLANLGNLNAVTALATVVGTQPGANASANVLPVVNGNTINLSNLNLSTLNLATLRSIVEAILAAPGSSQSAEVTALLTKLSTLLGQNVSLQSLQTLLNNSSLLNLGNLTGAELLTTLRNLLVANASSNISGGAQTSVSPSVEAAVKSKLL